VNIAALRAGIVVAALLIAWRIVQVNVVLYDENGHPRLPARASPSADAATIDAELLQRMLARNPGHVVALLHLAREHERAGEAEKARQSYEAAYALAPLDREVLGAVADYHLRQGSNARALALLDRLVDAYPDARSLAFPVLGKLLLAREQPAAWSAIAARKASWIGPFIESSCRQGMDPAALVPLLLARVADRRAAAEEIGCIVDNMRARDRWAEAYQVWLNTLPRERLSEVGFVYNGSFEFAASGVGFDWRPSRARERDSGHVVETPQAAGVAGQRALRVAFNGKRQVGIPIMQFVALQPGRYEMSGLARPQSITAGRGVQWTMRCLKRGEPQPVLAASERFVGSSEWRRFSFEIGVPADCPGQLLQLEPLGLSEGVVYLAGTAWFDDLVLRRLR
jgi:tetratricopeptide (TPR) repeat protein